MSNEKKSIPFRKILDFHEQTLGLSDAEKLIIAQGQSIDFNEYQHRIRGKEKEMEFLIIMKSLGSFKDIKPIDEEFSQLSGENTPDFEVELIDGYKMMIEVKHTDTDKFKITNNNLQKRINYATAHNLPLRFAISIKGFWGLFTSDYLQSQNGKITISDYMGNERNSWLDRELDTCSYMLLKPLKIVSVYSKKTTSGLNIFFEPYGELISYELYCSNRLILRVNHEDDSKHMHMIVLETVQDRLSNIAQEITTNGDLTTIVEHNDNAPCQCFAEYLFIMAVIKHIRYKGKNSRDNIFLTASESDGHIMPVECIRVVMSELSDLGVDIICFKDGLGYIFNDYRSKIWTKRRNETRK